MTELYPHAETQRMKKRVRRLQCFVWAIAALTLTGCIVCCVKATTLTALRLQWTAVGVSTAGGWLVMLLYSLCLSPLSALQRHAEGLTKGEAEIYAGVLTLQKESFRIPHSITVRKVALEDEDDAVTLHVAEAMAQLLPENGTRVKVTAVRKYITAWEVCHEND